MGIGRNTNEDLPSGSGPAGGIMAIVERVAVDRNQRDRYDQLNNLIGIPIRLPADEVA